MRFDVEKGVYLSGFARGGTTWARQIISAHPDVFEVPTQVGFRAARNVTFDQIHIEKRIAQILGTLPSKAENIAELQAAKHFIVKAPPNSLILEQMMDALPLARHVFIMRDPRDVLVSHQRTGAAWTEAHRNYDMAMQRTASFYRGYEKVKGRDNLLLFRYEDVHQQFPSTFRKICTFLGLEVNDELVDASVKALNFRAVTGRGHQEQKGMNRRGVVGDWVKNLSFMDGERLRKDAFWQRVMAQHSYKWGAQSLRKILKSYAKNSMITGGQNLKTVGASGPGAHILWSLSNTVWDNMEAVNGTLQRCRESYAYGIEQGFYSSVMLATVLPQRVIKPLLNSLPTQAVFLEVNVDLFSRDLELRGEEIVDFIEFMLPTINNLNPDGSLKAIVYGERIQVYGEAMRQLAAHGFEIQTLNGTGSEGDMPIAWINTDSTNAMTVCGLPEGFDVGRSAEWQVAQHMKVYFIAQMAASHLDDPLSLGFRTCFDDVRNLS